jgi:hypothetical protein
MKHPPEQMRDTDARQALEAFITGDGRGRAKPAAAQPARRAVSGKRAAIS